MVCLFSDSWPLASLASLDVQREEKWEPIHKHLGNKQPYWYDSIFCLWLMPLDSGTLVQKWRVHLSVHLCLIPMFLDTEFKQDLYSYFRTYAFWASLTSRSPPTNLNFQVLFQTKTIFSVIFSFGGKIVCHFPQGSCGDWEHFTIRGLPWWIRW